MEERLRNLKKSRVSKHLEFTDQYRRNIYKAIEREKDKEADVSLAILQLLSQRKTGYDLLQLLIGRGIKKFQQNEGELYLLLHDLEQKEYILSEWKDNQKYYCLNQKGKRLLKKVEKSSKRMGDLLKGELLYE